MINSRKVLIVDDSKSVRQQVLAALEQLDIVVLEAEDGQEGIDLIESNEDISLVFVDIHMPNTNGIQMLQQLGKEIKEGLPVVMLTTESQPSLVRQARKLGAKGWIVKPFKPEQLVLVVRKLSRD